MNGIQDLDEYLEITIPHYAPEKNEQEIEVKEKFNRIGKQLADTGLTPKEDDDKFNLPSVSDALSANAKRKLENYLKKSPQYKTLTIQLDLLESELLVYKKIKRKDLVQKTQEMIDELSETRGKFVKLYKTKDYKAEKEASAEKIENSELLKSLKEKRKALEIEFSSLNPNSLIAKVKEYREMLNITEKFDSYTDIVDSEEVLDFDEVIADDSKFSFQQQYDNLCGHISDLIHISVKEIQDMPTNLILKALKEEADDDKIKALRDEIDAIKFQSSAEINKLKGYDDITNIMYDIFDFEIVDEMQPKEMLAAATIPYVKAIAFKSCTNLNMLRNLDDATAYGLMGLTLAINCWYKIQKIKDSPVSFAGFSHQYVVNSIKRGLYEIGSSSGTISPSVLANMVFYRKQKLDNFMKVNPELKDLPNEIVESLIDALEDKPKKIPIVATQADINAAIGGDQELESDVWANSSKSEWNDETFVEVKSEYEQLLKSLKDLFSMFQTRVDEEGNRYNTKFKLFDKYDYKLFRLLYGLEFKRESLNHSKTKANNNYTQEEMGIILAEYYKANGIPCEPLSQPAIADRKLKLDKKLKALMEENPSIKAGLQRLMYYCEANSAAIQTLSNKREEAEITKDRKELSEVYVDNAREMNKVLSDGKRLSDVYQASSENPLDDEIAQAFRSY